jgi:hypothetical protein
LKSSASAEWTAKDRRGPFVSLDLAIKMPAVTGRPTRRRRTLVLILVTACTTVDAVRGRPHAESRSTTLKVLRELDADVEVKHSAHELRIRLSFGNHFTGGMWNRQEIAA